MSSVCAGVPLVLSRTESGSAFIAAARIRFRITISIRTGTIAFRAVFSTGGTMIPVMLAIASTPESASTISVKPTHESQSPREKGDARMTWPTPGTGEIPAMCSTARVPMTRVRATVAIATSIAAVPVLVGP